MADQNPTGDGAAVVLQIPPDDLSYLRFTFAAVRDGAREDLDQFGEGLPSFQRQVREEAIGARMLDAIDGAPLSIDPPLVEFLADLAAAIDRDNEYGRVVLEHDAIRGVLAQVEGAVA